MSKKQSHPDTHLVWFHPPGISDALFGTEEWILRLTCDMMVVDVAERRLTAHTLQYIEVQLLMTTNKYVQYTSCTYTKINTIHELHIQPVAVHYIHMRTRQGTIQTLQNMRWPCITYDKPNKYLSCNTIHTILTSILQHSML